jgi:succinoglycan biosynthesis transport protein ExoP
VHLRDTVRAFRIGWPMVLVLALVGLLVGAVVAFAQRPAYVATAKAYVAVASATNAGDLVNSAQYTQQIATSFADIAGTSYVLRPVITRLKLDMTPAQLARSVSVTAGIGESVLEVQATDPSPTRAARIANAIAARLSTTVASLTPIGGRVDVTVVDPAVPPGTPIGATPLLLIGLGAGAGLLLGALLAVLRVLTDTRLRTAQDIGAVSSIPILASTPLDTAVRRHAVVLGDDPQGPLAESYRSLRAALQFLDVDEGARSIVVTSSVEAEGKSVTAVNLAVALADTGERVLLVDADLRRPGVAGLLGLDGTVGLTDVLIDRVPLDQALQPDERGLLTVLPSGAVPPNPNELLQSRALERLLAVLEERFDRVVIDAPPVLQVSDAAILAHRASGALLLVGSGQVKRAQLQGALDVFRQTRAPVLGIVLTMVPLRETNAGAAARTHRRGAGRSGATGATRAPFVPTPLEAPASADPVPAEEPSEPEAPREDAVEPQPVEPRADEEQLAEPQLVEPELVAPEPAEEQPAEEHPDEPQLVEPEPAEEQPVEEQPVELQLGEPEGVEPQPGEPDRKDRPDR